MTEVAGGAVKVCIRLNCERRGQPTQDDRCPSCDFPTREMHEFRPDPSPAQMAAEGVVGPIGVPAARPRVLAVTTNDIPGYRVTAVHGDVYGITVRARNYFSNLGASLRTVVGGEVSGYTRLLSEARAEARERLLAEAGRRGANAVLAMRFDCNEIGDIMNEIAAYGTAVSVEKIDPNPTDTAHTRSIP